MFPFLRKKHPVVQNNSTTQNIMDIMFHKQGLEHIPDSRGFKYTINGVAPPLACKHEKECGIIDGIETVKNTYHYYMWDDIFNHWFVIGGCIERTTK